MAATPEAKVKRKVVEMLKARKGLYYFYPVTGGFGKSGVPDIVACYRGRFLGIECKAGANKTTALQEMNLKAIAAADGISLVVHGMEGLPELERVLAHVEENPHARP